MRVEGLKELQDKLRQLAPNVARNGLAAAVGAGAAVIRVDAKVRAPYYQGDVAKGQPPPGTLKRSIVQKQIPERSSLFKQVFYVTVRRGKQYRAQGKKGNLSQDAYYWPWVEFGTTKMSARPFLRPAFEAQKQAAVMAIKNKLIERIDQEAEKR
jgi:HK97 gp10 family phage protein